jgi:hypothetical protein
MWSGEADLTPSLADCLESPSRNEGRSMWSGEVNLAAATH